MIKSKIITSDEKILFFIHVLKKCGMKNYKIKHFVCKREAYCRLSEHKVLKRSFISMNDKKGNNNQRRKNIYFY